MPQYEVIAQSNENTVAADYVPVRGGATAYQSEAELEEEFVRLLAGQGYERVAIRSEAQLIANLRAQLQRLNAYAFSDGEWQRFFKNVLANSEDDIEKKTFKIQEDFIQSFLCDDGVARNIRLIDKENIHNNALQVMQQYAVGREDGARYDNRYDVSVLVNGLPLVHVELKRRGVNLREAFNQINRYQRDSFGAGSGLFEFVQIFVISNGTHTKYYSNTMRYSGPQVDRKKNAGGGFSFTSFWATAKNKPLEDLIDFAKTFFAKHTLLNVLTKYCVFTTEKQLLVMRPYQIAACEAIIQKIGLAQAQKWQGSREAGGYVWHTTGSGKTLTSFKTAQLATGLDFVHKVLFVVDRKDLDHQTIKEYDRFQKGAANGNASTKVLESQLADDDAKIIITTIQKLSNFIKRNSKHAVYDKDVVIVFDECHRSQFGDMHRAISRNFKKYYMFGFTGTPIFAANADAYAKKSRTPTTEMTFGKRLHTYTIVDAIGDKNVLPFRVDYVRTFDKKENIQDEQVQDIDRSGLYRDPRRAEQVVRYILEHFDQKTYRGGKSYELNVTGAAPQGKDGAAEELRQRRRVKGFNALMAVESVEMAKLYYTTFQRLMKEKPAQQLKIATIFSYAANEEIDGDFLGEENPEDTSQLDGSSRDFLERAIGDYNAMFGCSYDTSADKFQNYYKDVSQRMKNKELDLLIVVNMFLTGFDAKTLNTLWVDKNLKMHGLIQAFSRTNRILNSVKNFGNIVCFREGLREKVDEALAVFGDSNAGGVVLIRSFADFFYGYERKENGGHEAGYVELVQELRARFPVGQRIEGEQKQKEFIKLFGELLRKRNILLSFDDFADKEREEGLSERDLQDYLSAYQDLRDDWGRHSGGERIDISDDVVFEVELLHQVEITIDYILILVEQYRDSHRQDEEIRTTINKAVDASPELRSKKQLINDFIDRLHESGDVPQQWQEFIAERRRQALDDIIASEKLKAQETKDFIANAFRDGEVKTSGTNIDDLMPPISRFGSNNRQQTKRRIIDKLKAFFEQFFGIGVMYRSGE